MCVHHHRHHSIGIRHEVRERYGMWGKGPNSEGRSSLTLRNPDAAWTAPSSFGAELSSSDEGVHI
jgi:hypothetical protein